MADAHDPFTLATIPRPENGEKLYAVIGDPVKHSLSPQMHNAAFRALGLNSRYVKIHLAPEELAAGVEKMKAHGFSGWNVTVPHKTAMYALVDDPNPSAQAARAVNTVAVREGRLFGAGTDGLGWQYGVTESLGLPERKRVLLVGAGGSTQALAVFLDSIGAPFTIANRTPAKARAIAALVPRHARVAETPEEIAAAVAAADLIVNTTSLGLKPDDGVPVDLPTNLSGKYAYDLIYSPAETAFLRAAKAAGARAANGLSMLLWQGVFAFEHWHPALTPEQKTAATGAMRRALEEATGQALPARS